MCMHMYMYVCMYVCMYLCMYIEREREDVEIRKRKGEIDGYVEREDVESGGEREREKQYRRRS